MIVEDADLEAIERQNTSRSIDIERFVAARRGRPGLLRPHVLPRAGGGAGRAAAVRAAAAARCEEEQVGAIGRFVLAGQGEALPDPPEGRRARARDAVRRRGRLLAGRDRGGRRRRRRSRRPSSTSRASSIDSLVGEFDPSEQLTSEYRQDLRRCSRRSSQASDRGAGAGRGDAGDRPDGGAQEERRRGEASARRRREEPRPKRARRSARPPARSSAELLASACGGAAPIAWSCAWKRNLSILPW